MPMRAVQQIMLGTVTAKENQAVQTLSAIKKAGYDGIELNGFMIRPTSFMVRMMTKIDVYKRQGIMCFMTWEIMLFGDL